VTAPRRYAIRDFFGCYEIMACVTLVYRLSSGLLSLPRYFTRPQRGAALSRQQTDSELMHFFAEASDADSVHQPCRHLSCCWKTQINSCSTW